MSGARDDGRLAEAKLIPIAEVVDRLGLAGLRRAGRELVGACPVCGDGGKRSADRFSVNPDLGVFNCRGCGGRGDQIALVQHVQGCEFPGALAFLVGEAQAQVDPAVLAERRAKAERAEAERREYAEKARARRIRQAREIWHAAQGGDAAAPVLAYLAGRGVRFPDGLPPTIRFLPDHPYLKWVGQGEREVHRGPAMIAAIQNAAGRVMAVHQTWINPAVPGEKASIVLDGEAQPAKLVRGSKKGGAIRLTALGTSGQLVLGEGLETTASALTVGAMPAAAYWVAVDLGNMAGRQIKVAGKRHSGLPDLSDDAAWVPPVGVSQLVLIQDGDSNPAATRAAMESCGRRAQACRPGIMVQLVHPGEGRDLNDLLRENESEGGEK